MLERVNVKIENYKVSGELDYLREAIAIIKSELKSIGENDYETVSVNGNCKYCGERLLPYGDYCCSCGRKVVG